MESARKSRRLATKPEIVYVSVEEPPDDDPQYRVATAKKPRAKHCSKTHTGKRRKRGMLAELAEFPLDVLFEIFIHLTPHDLLRLTRTTKMFRDLLLKRSSISVWKGARANVEGLPDIPDDLSEPAYASLVFDNWCSECFAPNVKCSAWSLRKRLCQNCLNNSLNYARSYYVFDQEPEKFKDCYLTFRALLKGRGYHPNRTIYSAEQIRQIRAEYTALSVSNVDASALDDWLEVKKEEASKRHKHSELLVRWAEEVNSQHGARLAEIRQGRRDAIIEKLKEAGYGDVLENLSTRMYHPLDGLKQINVARKLTAGDWNKIKDKAIQLMQEQRARIIEEERKRALQSRCAILKKVVKDYFATLPYNHISPGYGDIANKPTVHALICDTPVTETVTEEDFQETIEEMSEFTREWREAKTSEVLSKAWSCATADDLERVTTVFRCGKCAQLLWYPRVLVHRCFMRPCSISFYSAPEPFNYLDGSCPWSSKDLTFSQPFSSLIRQFLEHMDLSVEMKYAELASKKLLLELHTYDEDFPICDKVIRFENLYVLGNLQLLHYSLSVITKPETISDAETKEKAGWQTFCTGTHWVYGNNAGTELYECKECGTLLLQLGISDHFKKEHSRDDCSPDDVTFPLDHPYQPKPIDLKSRPVTDILGGMLDFLFYDTDGPGYDSDDYDGYGYGYYDDDF